MSKENLDQFIQKVTDDEQLQARVGEEIDADSLIALGAENDCEFTADDLTTGAELSDEELDGVAGGLIAIIALHREVPKYRIGRKHESGTQVTDTERDYLITKPGQGTG